MGHRTASFARAALFAAIALAGAALPASALAITRVQIHIPGQTANRVPTAEAYLFIYGDEGANNISLHWRPSGTRFLVRDSDARVVARECVARGAHAALCPTEPAEDNFAALGDAGDDILKLGLPPRDVDAALIGQVGDDTLIGGNFDDVLGGGPDNDELRGRGGDDLLDGSFGVDILLGGHGEDEVGLSGFGPDGDFGRDLYRGGPGDDRLSGIDGLSDLGINGGGGDDLCGLDRRGDPQPRGCEKIRQCTGRDKSRRQPNLATREGSTRRPQRFLSHCSISSLRLRS